MHLRKPGSTAKVYSEITSSGVLLRVLGDVEVTYGLSSEFLENQNILEFVDIRDRQDIRKTFEHLLGSESKVSVRYRTVSQNWLLSEFTAYKDNKNNILSIKVMTWEAINPDACHLRAV